MNKQENYICFSALTGKQVKEGNTHTRMHERAYTYMCTFIHIFNERNVHIRFQVNIHQKVLTYKMK